MGFRFRKSISLGKLLKLNISKSGIGVSGGVRGARLSVSPDGKVRGSVGLPGTGVSYTKVLGDITPNNTKAPAKTAAGAKKAASSKTDGKKTAATKGAAGRSGPLTADEIAAGIPGAGAGVEAGAVAADTGADDTLGIPPAPKGAARRFCTSCGKRAAASDRFCRYCGARVPTADPD